jgi:hypothetical protein
MRYPRGPLIVCGELADGGRRYRVERVVPAAETERLRARLVTRLGRS